MCLCDFCRRIRETLGPGCDLKLASPLFWCICFVLLCLLIGHKYTLASSYKLMRVLLGYCKTASRINMVTWWKHMSWGMNEGYHKPKSYSHEGGEDGEAKRQRTKTRRTVGRIGRGQEDVDPRTRWGSQGPQCGAFVACPLRGSGLQDSPAPPSHPLCASE